MFGKRSWTITHLLCVCVYVHAQSLHGTVFFFCVCVCVFGKPGTCPHSLGLKCENDLTGQLVNASLLHNAQWGQTKWNAGVGTRERFIAGPCKEMGGFNLRTSEPPKGFQQIAFKSQVRDGGCRVCDQTVYNSLIGWWQGNRSLIGWWWGSRSLIGWWWGSHHVWMWELDHKESWAPKNWCFWTVVLEKTLESPLDCKNIQPVHPKGNQSWIFIERSDVEAETLILWPPDVKTWLIWKDLDAGKDWRCEEKGTTEDEIIVWHHLLNGNE